MSIKLNEFDKIVSEMRATFVRKNHDYGDENITVLGVKGIFVRQWDKVSRLKQLILNNINPSVNESVLDTLMDLACYCIIAIIVLRNKWK